ncbi:hypothetical protein Tco_0198983 [Tanacetum coccineum]
MSSSLSHATVMYTSMSSDDDVLLWGIPLMDAYDSDPEAPEAVPQCPDQASLSPAHALVYSECLAPPDDDLEPAEAQPLPTSVSPTALSLDYSAYSEPVKEDLEEDLEEDPKKEPSKEEEEEEEKLSDLVDSPLARLYIDLPSEVEEDERGSCTCTFITTTISTITPIISIPRIPSPPLLLPPPTHRDIIPEAEMTPQKRARFAAPSYRFEIGESSAAIAARKPWSALARGTDFGFVTALEEVNERVTNLATSHKHDSEEFHSRRPHRLTTHIQRDRAREDARDLERHDGPTDADNSS